MNIYDIYEERLHGPYTDIIIGFIKRNKALGFKCHYQISKLVKFDEFTIGRNDLSPDNLPKDIITEWVNEPSFNHDQIRRRAILMNQFGEYMLGLGKEAYLYPKRKSKAPAKYIPYIFTNNQILALMKKADSDAQYHPTTRSRVDTAVILRILYGCGLRISEVTGLKICDVDLENGILRIWQSKLKKDRFVPMSTSLVAACSEYKTNHLQQATPDCFFFSPDGKRKYSTQTIYSRFRNLIFECGIPHRGKGLGPRLHDLRHTFAVHSLRQLSETGLDLYVSLPILSAFLGHSSVSATQWYLHLTAEVFPDVTTAVDKHFGDIYPEVRHE